MSEQLFQSFIHATYHDGNIMAKDLGIGLTTGQVNLMVLGRLSEYGWSWISNEECLIDVYYYGEEIPEFQIRKEKGLKVSARLKIDLKCRKN